MTHTNMTSHAQHTGLSLGDYTFDNARVAVSFLAGLSANRASDACLLASLAAAASQEL